jgi:hypothetical protein
MLILIRKFFDSDGWGFHGADGDGTANSVDFAEESYGVFADATYKNFKFMGFTGNITDTAVPSRPRSPDVSANLFIDNLLDENINFVAGNSTTANTLPLHRRLSLFGTLTVKY